MVRKTTRCGKRVLVIDFTYTKPDGAQGRYRRDAAVQTTAAAQTEETARRMGATLFGNPDILCGANGHPLKPVEPVSAPEAPKALTLGETIDRYLTEYAPSALSPSPVDGYRARLRTHIVPRLGALRVSEAFEVARSREVDVAMIARGTGAGQRRTVLLALRSVAKFAVEAKILPHLPAFLPLPTLGKRVPRAPAPGDVAAAIDAVRHAEWRLVILLAAHGGLRKGEILALRCGDCELDRNRLVVRLSRWKSHTGTTKSGDDREVPLTEQLREALLVAGVDTRPRDECAALSTFGKPWGDSGPYKVFQRTLVRLNLPRERFHALRAFFVTTLLNGHVPPHVVMDLAGHGDLATTQMYAAVVEGDGRAAVGVLERVYRGAHCEPADARAGTPGKRRERGGSSRRGSRVTGRIRELRRRVRRRRGPGNGLETALDAAE